jgi:hypothetical protein
MDAPEMAEAELETAGPKASEEPTTGSKRKYRKMSRGSGAAGGHKKYKGGGLSGL